VGGRKRDRIERKGEECRSPADHRSLARSALVLPLSSGTCTRSRNAVTPTIYPRQRFPSGSAFEAHERAFPRTEMPTVPHLRG